MLKISMSLRGGGNIDNIHREAGKMLPKKQEHMQAYETHTCTAKLAQLTSSRGEKISDALVHSHPFFFIIKNNRGDCRVEERKQELLESNRPWCSFANVSKMTRD